MLHESPIIQLGGFNIDLSVIIMLIVTCAIVFGLAFAATRNLSVDNPSKLQNFMEWVVEFVQGLITSTMDLKKEAIPLLGDDADHVHFRGEYAGLTVRDCDRIR